ncbi:MAG: radical SAM protein, partial [Nitrososphaerota archaeon]|nr:radical SAM protein [Nitrososphaerota archaeon]
MSLISRFDPWQSGLCTCPQKLTFNPYTGCDHNCLYCYASNYIMGFNECKPKNGLLERLRRDASKLRGEVISLSNSSDPYPKIEQYTGLTRKCLEILVESNCRIQIITKSNLVVRDDDLLKQVPSTVAFTITTDDDVLAKILEPNAPLPSQRLS